MRVTLNRIGGLIAAVLLAAVSLVATATAANARPAPAGSITPFVLTFHPISNAKTHMCLQPDNASTDLFVPIVQELCNGSREQNWAFIRRGTNHYNFMNQVSSLCLWAWDGAFNGGRVLQDECNQASNSEFNTGRTLPDVTFMESRVGFNDTGFCVNVPDSLALPGSAMQILACDRGNLAQRWVIGF